LKKTTSNTNYRVDEIREAMHHVMDNKHMMEFMGMAVGFPMLGLGMFAFGAPASALAMLSVAAPMYLMRFLTNGHMEREDTPVYQHHETWNLTLPENAHIVDTR
jgi:hypothetical protein